MWKWVLPRVNTLLEERREKIQGEPGGSRAGDTSKATRSYRVPESARRRARGGQPDHRGGPQDRGAAPPRHPGQGRGRGAEHRDPRPGRDPRRARPRLQELRAQVRRDRRRARRPRRRSALDRPPTSASSTSTSTEVAPRRTESTDRAELTDLDQGLRRGALRGRGGRGRAGHRRGRGCSPSRGRSSRTRAPRGAHRCGPAGGEQEGGRERDCSVTAPTR